MNEAQRHMNDENDSALALLLRLEEQSLEESVRQVNGRNGLPVSELSKVNFGDAFIANDELARQAETLRQITGDSYQKHVISPAENNDRYSVIKLISEISERIIQEKKEGPLYLAEVQRKIYHASVHPQCLTNDRIIFSQIKSEAFLIIF